jgi:hypothetical protein
LQSLWKLINLVVAEAWGINHLAGKWIVSIGTKCTDTVWCYWSGFPSWFQSSHPVTCVYAKLSYAGELLGPGCTTLISLAKKRNWEPAHIIRPFILSANGEISTFVSTPSTPPVKSG